MNTRIAANFNEHIEVIQKSLEVCGISIDIAGVWCLETILGGQKIFFCGNGGSAADADHLAAEFTGKYQVHRRGLPAISLSSDSSAITSIGNDYGFDQVFARQLEALGKPGDLLVAISTSGNSPNVCKAVEKAREMDIKTIALTGRNGGQLTALADLSVVIPSDVTSRIQEAHILIGHIWCNYVEQAL